MTKRAERRSLASADNDDPLLADLVADLANRLAAGEAVDPEEYAGRHPDRAEQLRLIWPAVRMMAELGGSTVGSAPQSGRLEPTPKVGFETLGDYRLLRELGRGGMGVVYEAEQISLGRRVALKVLPFAAAFDAKQQRRFRLEAQVAGCLHHTNIVPVHAVGSERGVSFYVMQLIEGRSLAQVITELRRLDGLDPEDDPSPSPADALTANLAAGLTAGLTAQVGNGPGPDDPTIGSPPGETVPETAFPPRAPALPASASRDADAPRPNPSTRGRAYIRGAAHLALQAAEALDHAHSRGILHRDIKPGNLLLDAEGNLWVTDFGLAQIQGDNRLTLTGDILGTLRYMSPEQALARRVVIDGRTDVYSLGVTLYELLTLRPAFDGRDRAEILRMIAEKEAVPLRKLNPSVPLDLETIVRKATEKEPSQRYSTAAELAADLRRFLESRPIAARRVGPAERLVRWGHRNPWVAGLSGLLVLCLVAVAFGATVAAFQFREARDHLEASLYFKSIALAESELKASGLGRAEDLLSQCPPRLRGWEWWHLARQCRTDAQRIIPGHHKEVRLVAFSPDGQFLASGSLDATIKVWDALSGALVHSLSHDGPVLSVAFSPDGRLIASGTGRPQRGGTGVVSLWDSRTGERVARLDSHTGPVWSVAFSPDGHLLASAGEDRVIRLWDLRTRKPAATLAGHEGIVTSLAFSHDGRLASGGYDLSIRIWDTIAGQQRHLLAGLGDPVWSLSFGPDGRTLASATSDNKVMIWDTTAGVVPRPIHSIQTFGDCIVSFSPDGHRLGVANLVGVNAVRLYETATWEKVLELSGHAARLTSVAFSPTGRRLAAGGEDGAVVFWDADPWIPSPGEEPVTLVGHGGPIYAVEFSHDGRQVATASGDKSGRIWDAANGKVLRRFVGNKKPVFCITFHPGGRWVALSSDRQADDSMGEVQVWDPVSGDELPLPVREPQEVLRLAFSPDGRWLATAGAESTATVYRFPTGEKVRTFSGHDNHIWGLAFDASGRRLLTSSRDGTLKLWDLETEKCLLQTFKPPSGTFNGAAYDGRAGRVAAGSGDGTITIWDENSGRAIHTVRGHDRGIWALAFSPDGRLLASGGEDGTVRLWDVARERQLKKFRGHTGIVTSIAFNPDGTRLVSGSTDCTAKLWDILSWAKAL